MSNPTISDPIAAAITDYFGERCPDFSDTCPCCIVWAQYDALRSKGEEVKPLIDAAENAAMYLDTGFIECPRCGHEVETKNTDAEDALRTALSAISHPSEPEQCAAPPAATSKPSPLTPLHIDLLRRGARGQFIWFHDQAGLHTSEVCAVGDLCRAGLAKEADIPAIPGPPCPPDFEITEAGRALVAALSEKTP